MIVENINIEPKKPRIIVSALDWGLGHATRIIPLVTTLEAAGAEVILAASGSARILLQKELPGRLLLTIPGYDIRYGKNNKTFFLKLLLQLPKVMGIIRKENKMLRTMIAENRIDAVISDNRFGFYSSQVPSVYITHQLYIETGGGKAVNAQAQKIHYGYIKKFSECWVPDFTEAGLAGKLSHPQQLPSVPVKYLGPLSRLKKEQQHTEEKKLLIVLSGPEPQRSIWEEQLLQQLKTYQGKVVLVRGLPQPDVPGIEAGDHCTVHNYLSSEALAVQMLQAAMVICRSGYSTVMDLAALDKKAILVPTPGQGEQEYLGQYLMEEKFFYSCTQEQFRLEDALKNVQDFPFKKIQDVTAGLHIPVILDWIERLKLRAGQ
ncbi:MAG: glycosyltransferase [Ferruginibacter sp.]